MVVFTTGRQRDERTSTFVARRAIVLCVMRKSAVWVPNRPVASTINNVRVTAFVIQVNAKRRRKKRREKASILQFYQEFTRDFSFVFLINNLIL